MPIALYVTWWLWARTSTDAGSGIVASNVLLIPAWGFESLGAIVSSMVGLNYRFAGAPEPIQAGAPLALAGLAALAWRISKAPLPPAFWPALAAILALWALQALAADGADNFPASPHYLFPVTLLALLAAVQAASGLRWSGIVLLVVFGVAGVALATNLSLLRQEAAKYRYEYTPEARAALTGLDVADSSAVASFAFEGLPLDLGLYSAFRGTGERPTAAYVVASERFGGTWVSPGRAIRDRSGRTAARGGDRGLRPRRGSRPRHPAKARRSSGR